MIKRSTKKTSENLDYTKTALSTVTVAVLSMTTEALQRPVFFSAAIILS